MMERVDMGIPSLLVTGTTGNIGQSLMAQWMQTPSFANVVAASPAGQFVAGAPSRALNPLDPASAKAAMRGVEPQSLLTQTHPEMETMIALAVQAAQATGRTEHRALAAPARAACHRLG